MRRLLLSAALVLAALPSTYAQHKAPPWEKNPLQAGRTLYRQNCTVCHEVNRPETRKVGGSLYRFFQKEDSPLQLAQREPYFRIKVMLGSKMMPAFRTRLTPQQIDQLIGYVRSQDGLAPAASATSLQ